ncbi:MAG: RDD family protein, partial [Anaerolineae bacterium]|nr:RDD family protein [Anaerolineae bacterium]
MKRGTHEHSDWVPCGMGRRLLIMVYDGLVVVALLILAGAIALPITGSEQQAFRDPLYTLYLIAVWFAYLGWCWTRGGQTVGMRAWKARIVTLEGHPPGWRASSIRFVMSLLSALPLAAGFWMSVLHRER